METRKCFGSNAGSVVFIVRFVWVSHVSVTFRVSGFAPRRLRSKIHCTRGLCRLLRLNDRLIYPDLGYSELG